MMEKFYESRLLNDRELLMARFRDANDPTIQELPPGIEEVIEWTKTRDYLDIRNVATLQLARDIKYEQDMAQQIFLEIEGQFECPDSWQLRWQALKNRWCGKMPEGKL